MCLIKIYRPKEDPLRTTFKPILAYKWLDVVPGAPDIYASPCHSDCFWKIGTLHTANLDITWGAFYRFEQSSLWKSLAVDAGLHAFRSHKAANKSGFMPTSHGSIIAAVEIPPYSCYVTSTDEIVATQMRLVSVVTEIPRRAYATLF